MLSAPQYHRIDEDTVIVDQPRSGQGRYNAAASVDHQVLPGLLLHVQDFLLIDFPEQSGVIPFGLFERTRENDFG